MTKVRLAIGCDHAGYKLKEVIIRHLSANGISTRNFGTDSGESVDYPDFAHPVANAVENGEADFGILICGSGNGISMAANKHAGIRAAVCWKPEIAGLARMHNDANILSLPARFISDEDALRCVDIFLSTPFEGGRHANRVNKIPCHN
ncbi:MAG TPA: ribose 5-phosphate isomerase B [Bacteroidia bacterium]|nr:ribose 5-phosphate isomerase B [Bacteroidia bacterium]